MARTWKDTKQYRRALGRKVGLVGGIDSGWKWRRRKARRCRERTALRSGREPPVFRRCDAWDWW